MPEHHSVNVRGRTLDFHIYVDVPNSVEKIRQLERFLNRLPDAHLALVYPIFVMERKPAGRLGGGTWTPGQVRTEFMGHTRNTAIPDADVELYAATRGTGIIGLSRDRWLRPMGRLEFTLFHEIGHCIDFQLGLVPPGATAASFEGMMTNRCGAGGMIVRRAVEAYARYICAPSRVYHSPLPAAANPATINSGLIATLRSSPAFRNVPSTWQPR